MTLSMYQASVPLMTRMLTNLDAILTKAEADATARKIDPAVFLGSRLAPDMHPLTRQVQTATDMAKGGAARLAGVEVPSFPDTETTFADLHARIAKTIAFIGSVDASHIDGSEEKEITLKFPNGAMTFSGMSYLLNFVLPNLFFHITTAYAILRHNGVAVGKMDFMGAR